VQGSFSRAKGALLQDHRELREVAGAGDCGAAVDSRFPSASSGQALHYAVAGAPAPVGMTGW